MMHFRRHWRLGWKPAQAGMGWGPLPFNSEPQAESEVPTGIFPFFVLGPAARRASESARPSALHTCSELRVRCAAWHVCDARRRAWWVGADVLASSYVHGSACGSACVPRRRVAQTRLEPRTSGTVTGTCVMDAAAVEQLRRGRRPVRRSARARRSTMGARACAQARARFVVCSVCGCLCVGMVRLALACTALGARERH
jgi:hypothetical protein